MVNQEIDLLDEQEEANRKETSQMKQITKSFNLMRPKLGVTKFRSDEKTLVPS
jgi:hypothetical protein